jgi:hypothetical protein
LEILGDRVLEVVNDGNLVMVSKKKMTKASAHVLEPRGVDERLDLQCEEAQNHVHLP